MDVGRVLLVGAGVVAVVGVARQRREAASVRTGRLAALGPDNELELGSGDVHRRLAGWQPRRPRTVPGRLAVTLWALPNSVLGLGAALLGGRLPRWDATAACWVAAPVAGPTGAALRAVGATAATLGQVVVSRRAPLSPRLLAHEALHARQQERLGPLFAPGYGLAQARWGYRANPFEVGARRAAKRSYKPPRDASPSPTRRTA